MDNSCCACCPSSKSCVRVPAIYCSSVSSTFRDHDASRSDRVGDRSKHGRLLGLYLIQKRINGLYPGHSNLQCNQGDCDDQRRLDM
jgi:hypothetical protein